jgi:hypothetical protein
MRAHEVVVCKCERAWLFESVWLFREGLHLAPHPPCVRAYRQMVALHPLRSERAAARRRPHGRFALRGGPRDEAGRPVDHATGRALFDHDRVAHVGWGRAAGVGHTPT